MKMYIKQKKHSRSFVLMSTTPLERLDEGERQEQLDYVSYYR